MKVYTLLLYKKYDHNPSDIFGVYESFDGAFKAIQNLSKTTVILESSVLNYSYGSCDIYAGFEWYDKWEIADFDVVPDIQPEKEGTVIPPAPVVSEMETA